MADIDDQGVKRMEDIARIVGVSKSTVSRALKNSSQISEKTKAKIRKIAFEHNYRLSGASWQWQESNMPAITVVLPTGPGRRGRISEPFTMEMVGCIADELLDRNHNMLLTKLPLENQDTTKTLLSIGPSEGVIIIGQRKEHYRIRQIARDIPNLIVWGARLDDQNYCTVGSDNVEGGYMATKHLLRLGRQNIAYFGDLTAAEPRHRYMGYKKALEDTGFTVDPDLVVETPYDQLSAFAEARSWLRLGFKFDAIFASSDVVAMSAIAAMRESGISVPDDVAVVGYDDIPMAEYYQPPLTTVRQNLMEGSSMLVDKLLRMAEGNRVRSAVMPCELIIRQSCGSSK
ncbi:MAG: LacI family DNA-binding transcriptional regulator [Kordiimonadaceae bacterium]|nr:LacI family DNA-binding transcriptional regulator [Kordiimonadaceae bacterium]MBO6569202.1 LacI family DNA-binding transcriptional regulator [Kordiimonadaceae bacterium]MBO6964678.1 LacI family DNA-binding transcriptional regulator [Kordiimonadaceae bacterium]